MAPNLVLPGGNKSGQQVFLRERQQKSGEREHMLLSRAERKHQEVPPWRQLGSRGLFPTPQSLFCA